MKSHSLHNFIKSFLSCTQTTNTENVIYSDGLNKSHFLLLKAKSLKLI